ncbi:MAG: Crp/Fnr family transcriptional regulator [Bacteroidales bacterium]|nr:Crp/Fnr family transcriptional regulator [Bacteroidales bacterium]
MLAEILKKSFDQYFTAPIEAWEEFAGYCEPVTFEKDEIIKSHNAVEKYFYFILSGSAGIFLWNENNFVCLDFAFDHSFCCDYMSLLLKQPTPLQVVSLEQSEMVRIKSEDFYKLGRTPVGQIIVQISAETSFIDKQQQQIELLTKTAEERYKILLNKFPAIYSRVAQKHIASYLGITPQSLSRIRKFSK